MSRRRAAAAGLLAVALATVVAPFSSRAQTAPTACSARDPEIALDEMSYELRSPRTDRPQEEAVVPVDVSFTNEATLFGQPFEITDVTARILACDDELLLPDPNQAQQLDPDARTMTLQWSPGPFRTNGAYVLELVARGNRRSGPEQRSVVSVPLQLNVAPKPPQSVEADVTDDGTVLVTWSNAGREPDLGGYAIERAAEGSSTYRRLATVDELSNRFVDAPAVGGWRYRVVARRPGVDEPLETASSADAVEVTSPPTTTAGDGDGTGTGTGADAGTGAGGTGGTAGGSASTSTTRPSVTTGGRNRVDLNGVGGTAARRPTPTTARRPAEPDTGFDQTLPFNLDDAEDVEDAEEPGGEQEPAELGADDPQALGNELITDDAGERQRSLGFVAGGLLLFVLGLTGLFLKAEVRRADELDPLDPTPDADAEAAAPAPPLAPVAPAPVPAMAVAAAASTAALPRRRQGTDEDAATAPAALPRRRHREVPAPAAAADGTRAREERSARRRLRGAAAAAAADPTAEAAHEAPEAYEPHERPVPRRLGTASTIAIAPADAEAHGAPASETDAMVAAAGPAARRRRRGEARAERAARIAELFDTAEDDRTADDEAHLAALRPVAADGGTAAARRRPVRRTVAPLDAPGLDVPEPTPTRTTPHARRAPTGLPPGPADDRREGRPAVRPRRRGPGQGDRRVPVG